MYFFYFLFQYIGVAGVCTYTPGSAWYSPAQWNDIVLSILVTAVYLVQRSCLTGVVVL